MALFFNKCNVAVNGSGIMASTASITKANSLTPIRSVGNKGIIYQAPTGPLTTKYDMSYIVETNNEPNYNIVQALKSVENSFHNKPAAVEVGGVRACCYLKSYSLSCKPNEPVTASVSYESYKDTTGSLSSNTATPVTYNSQRSSGIAHGWTSFISTSVNALTNKSYGFDYGFEMTWSPSFTFGRLHPYDVRFINATETITLERDTSYDVTFSGQKASSALLGSGELGYVEPDKNINLHAIGMLCDSATFNSKLSFDISEATIIENSLDASLDDLVRSTLVLKNYY